MPLSDKRTIALRALVYSLNKLKSVDCSSLNPTVCKGVADVIDDLDGLIRLEIDDLPF